MPRPSNRDRLLHAGLRVVHERGLGAASVRDIVRAAGVPQGSFTNHWASKEAFGLDVLEAYSGWVDALLERTLRDRSRPALERLRAYVAAVRSEMCGDQVSCGCMFGNMSAEATEAGEPIRTRVVEIFAVIRADIVACLREATARGVLSPDTDCAGLGCVILSSLQGSILLAKAQRSAEPVEQFERLLFGTVVPALLAAPAPFRLRPSAVP